VLPKKNLPDPLKNDLYSQMEAKYEQEPKCSTEQGDEVPCLDL